MEDFDIFLLISGESRIRRSYASFGELLGHQLVLDLQRVFEAPAILGDHANVAVILVVDLVEKLGLRELGGVLFREHLLELVFQRRQIIVEEDFALLLELYEFEKFFVFLLGLAFVFGDSLYVHFERGAHHNEVREIIGHGRFQLTPDPSSGVHLLLVEVNLVLQLFVVDDSEELDFIVGTRGDYDFELMVCIQMYYIDLLVHVDGPRPTAYLLHRHVIVGVVEHTVNVDVDPVLRQNYQFVPALVHLQRGDVPTAIYGDVIGSGGCVPH